MNTLPEHNISMDIVSKSQGLPIQTLRKLYNLCGQALDNQTMAVHTSSESVSVLQDASQAVVVVATDMKSGVFVQLTKKEETPILMTIGKKFCIGHHDPVTRQTANQMTS